MTNFDALLIVFVISQTVPIIFVINTIVDNQLLSDEYLIKSLKQFKIYVKAGLMGLDYPKEKVKTKKKSKNPLT